MTKHQKKLTKRYNKDGSISVYSNGRVVLRRKGPYAHEQIEAFAKGWYGDNPVVWNRTKFAPEAVA